MVRFASITMSMRDIDRLKIVQAIIDGHLKASVAANRLQLTKRQVNRLVQRYRADGAAGLISRQRGQPGYWQLIGGIVLAKETVRKLMTEAGLWIPRKQRTPSIYQPRNRRSCVGELIQFSLFRPLTQKCMLTIGSTWACCLLATG
jgi:hypothetical protein